MTAFDLASRFRNEITELPGPKDHPFIRWCHSLTEVGDSPDEVPWCSSFVNCICWMLRLPRSKSARARSWLEVGHAVDVIDARPGYDVVILKRGHAQQGHVGFYGGIGDISVYVLGGNQRNGVTLQAFSINDILGIRRLQ